MMSMMNEMLPLILLQVAMCLAQFPWNAPPFSNVMSPWDPQFNAYRQNALNNRARSAPTYPNYIWVPPQPTPRPSASDISYFSLSEGYRNAFLTVEDLIQRRDQAPITDPVGFRNTIVLFDEQNRIINNTAANMVSNLLPSMVPGTWRTMTYELGCCPVLKFHATNETLMSMSRKQRKIVHFEKENPPRYQFIPHGLCAQSSYSTNGHCHQGYVSMLLLVYDLNFQPPITFDTFSIPAYCNCYNY